MLSAPRPQPPPRDGRALALGACGRRAGRGGRRLLSRPTQGRGCPAPGRSLPARPPGRLRLFRGPFGRSRMPGTPLRPLASLPRSRRLLGPCRGPPPLRYDGGRSRRPVRDTRVVCLLAGSARDARVRRSRDGRRVDMPRAARMSLRRAGSHRRLRRWGRARRRCLQRSEPDHLQRRREVGTRLRRPCLRKKAGMSPDRLSGRRERALLRLTAVAIGAGAVRTEAPGTSPGTLSAAVW
jgi:hypothetical protein